MTGFEQVVIGAGIGIWAASGIGGITILIRALRRPTNETDDYCARVDAELTEREHAVRCMGGGFRT